MIFLLKIIFYFIREVACLLADRHHEHQSTPRVHYRHDDRFDQELLGDRRVALRDWMHHRHLRSPRQPPTVGW
jgi:hypothetical protein